MSRVDLKPDLARKMPKLPADTAQSNKALAVRLRQLAAEISASNVPWFLATHVHTAPMQTFGAHAPNQPAVEQQRGKSIILTQVVDLIPRFEQFARQG